MRNKIKESEENIRRYLREGLLQQQAFNPLTFRVLLKNSEESLKVADRLYSQDISNLWTIVISYYSMFYIANAVLYKIGYKVGNHQPHKITTDALFVFVRNKLKNSLLTAYKQAQEEALEIAWAKADALLENFDRERIKRSVFQYETLEEVKKTKAQTSLNRAKEFIVEMEKLL